MIATKRLWTRNIKTLMRGYDMALFSSLSSSSPSSSSCKQDFSWLNNNMATLVTFAAAGGVAVAAVTTTTTASDKKDPGSLHNNSQTLYGNSQNHFDVVVHRFIQSSLSPFLFNKDHHHHKTFSEGCENCKTSPSGINFGPDNEQEENETEQQQQQQQQRDIDQEEEDDFYERVIGAAPGSRLRKNRAQQNSRDNNEKEDDEDEDENNDVPDYIPEHFRRDLGSALDHKKPLSSASRYGLATEAQYPIEHAHMTMAPDVPPPIKRQHPVHLIVDMACINKKMRISGNKEFEYWPFGFYNVRKRKWEFGVPGPFIRARVGDVLQVNFTNHDESGMAHSVDFHCVAGPGGGSPTTFAEQDETKTGAYLLQHPGLYVYHCAAAPIPVHINNGMFGLVLVEPQEGLPPVDKEFYIMQSDLYVCDSGEKGDNEQIVDFDAATSETPRYVFFNGKEGALIERPLMVKQDERVRLFVGNAGPNLISSFHVIGAIFDKVFREGDLVSPPARHIQTTLIPAGGAAVVDLCCPVPGTLAIVDHSIDRINKGAVGMIKVKGKPRPDIYDSIEPPTFCPGCKTHQ